MASVVSIPPVLHTALRSVEYTFMMPSIGTAPEEKYLRYRLKNVTDGIYLTDWKYYKPVSDGQNIEIDFYKDLFEIVSTPPPPFATPNSVVPNTTIIKKIAVEYGERTVNVETCDYVDTTDGITDLIDVINGIQRVYDNAQSLIGTLMSNRPKEYSIHLNTYDWIYIDGTMLVGVYYKDEQGNTISSFGYSTTQVHPSGSVTIIPIGFQNAPTGTTKIEVYSPTLITGSNPTGHAFTLRGDACGCDNGELRDLYFQNQYGGIDPITFDCIDSKTMSVVKQYITKRYDEGDANIRTTGQRRTIKNTSNPIITLKKSFDYATYQDSKWLDECAASSNTWIRETLPNGTDVLIRVNILDASVPTYGEEVEFQIQVQYSEEFIYPY